MEFVIYVLVALASFAVGWFTARKKAAEPKIVIENVAKASKRAYVRKAKAASAAATTNVSKVGAGYVNGAGHPQASDVGTSAEVRAE